MQRRQEILDDITDTTGAVFLGLTYGCARCHNHKFDPILQADYYRLQAFFANTARRRPHSDAERAENWRNIGARRPFGKQKTERNPRQDRAHCSSPRSRSIAEEYFDKYPPEIQAMILKPAAQRTPYEWQMYAKAKPYLEIERRRRRQSDCKGEREAAVRRTEGGTGAVRRISIPASCPRAWAWPTSGRNAPPTHVLGGRRLRRVRRRKCSPAS